MSDRPILYSFRRCPYAMRARMALLVSGTVCHIREVKLSRKPEALIAASPKATVPVIVRADGGVIEESIEIMRWSLERNDPEGWLEREDVPLIEAAGPDANRSRQSCGAAPGNNLPDRNGARRHQALIDLCTVCALDLELVIDTRSGRPAKNIEDIF